MYSHIYTQQKPYKEKKLVLLFLFKLATTVYTLCTFLNRYTREEVHEASLERWRTLLYQTLHHSLLCLTHYTQNTLTYHVHTLQDAESAL